MPDRGPSRTECSDLNATSLCNHLSPAATLKSVDATKKVTLGVTHGQGRRRLPCAVFIIGALVVVIGVLGYLYWDSEHNTLFKAPGVEIKKN